MSMGTSGSSGHTRRWRWAWRVLVVGLSAVALLGVSASEGRQSYVALGDSFTAGPLIPQQNQEPKGCLRSDHNYPHLVAPSLRQPLLRDASCSGAETEHMTQPQDVDPGPNPPQFDRLGANTTAVSLGIGGNDIGFSEIARNCASPVNQGTPCQDRYVVNGQDELSRRIAETAPLVAAVLQGIHRRSPRAQVFVVGYLSILPDQGPGCHPVMPITDGDVPYVRAKQKELNAMLAAQAAANDSVYVDAYTPSIGHDACQLPGVKWVEPPVPTSPAAPVHPNLDGMEATADILLTSMRAHGAA
jgi:hypothetical protein